jgi:L-cysteine:1D-myo-inositol 2-amino-2-deoxy-alpha-D-glucopyranoside ligase
LTVIAWPSQELPTFRHGHLPQLKLLDTATMRVREVVDEDLFTMYVCGITPYDATHLGHAATYLTFDLINRYQRISGRRVRFIENVTDIDDPLFERANRDQKNWQEIARDQIDLFRSDMVSLRVLPPENLVSVTEAMSLIIDLVTELINAGCTYSLETDIYLDSSQVTDFSELPMELAEALKIFGERGGDPDREGKRHPLDPLLWRRSGAGEPSWQAPFGAGRPGWHIECNAIAGLLTDSKYASMISLQGGGNDLAFPHHYMTAIQAKARSGHYFAHHYVHCGMIGYAGEKMSKSLGNLVFVSELLKGSIDPMAIRIALISEKYSQDREWSGDKLTDAQILLEQMRSALGRQEVPDYQILIEGIFHAISEDLDTPKAFNLIRQWLREVNEKPGVRTPGELSRFLDALLGLAI